RDRPQDSSLLKVPYADAASQVKRHLWHVVERRGGADEVARHHQVQFRPHREAVRVETFGRTRGMLGNYAQIAVALYDTAGRLPIRTSHHGDEKAAIGERMELVGDGREWRIGGREKSGSLGIGYIKEENLLLALQYAEQPAGSQHLAIRGQPYVVRLVAGR